MILSRIILVRDFFLNKYTNIFLCNYLYINLRIETIFHTTKTNKMTYASLIHIETGVEYYKNDNLYYPSANEKLLWAIFGTPDDIKMIVQTFETEIDNYTGFSKKEIQAKVNENFKDGLYNFLPAMGVNHNIEIRWGK